MNDHRKRHGSPILALTLGDVAGIGPELVVKGWESREIHDRCRPFVVGSASVLEKAAREISAPIRLISVGTPEEAVELTSNACVPCIEASAVDVAGVPLGVVDARAGQASYDYLVTAIDLALTDRVDGIVTLPLHKGALHAAGLPYPGHTEILAERTQSRDFGMMLYRRGLGVLHVTLHVSLRKALDLLRTESILEKTFLLDGMMRRLGCSKPRLAVAALNPHASDGGLFGQEETTLVEPAVKSAQEAGIQVTGPIAADTLFVRAAAGEFDGVVALYHDQGHIALKLLGWREAVNITVGLPIVRTSVAHGTAYDIVHDRKADPTSLFEAVKVADLLCRSRHSQESGKH